jgi:hypothetical protein
MESFLEIRGLMAGIISQAVLAFSGFAQICRKTVGT